MFSWSPKSTNREPVGCVGQISLTHGDPTLKPIGLKESADRFLVPDATGHWRSCL